MKNNVKIIFFLLAFAFLWQSLTLYFYSDLDSIELSENAEDSSLESYKDIKFPITKKAFLFGFSFSSEELPKKIIAFDDETDLNHFFEVSVPPPRALS